MQVHPPDPDLWAVLYNFLCLMAPSTAGELRDANGSQIQKAVVEFMKSTLELNPFWKTSINSFINDETYVHNDGSRERVRAALTRAGIQV